MNIDVILVHGGSYQLNRLMVEQGLKPKIIEGLRCTDARTLELAVEVFGKLNDKIVSILEKDEVKVAGIRGHENGFVMAESCGIRELGFVGRVKEINLELLDDLPRSTIPVITCLGVGSNGQIYNINADTVASELAVAIQAQKLVYLSDIDGVLQDKNNPQSLIPTLTPKTLVDFIKSGIITEGMVPKVRAAVEMLIRGVDKVHIINGTRQHALLFEILTDKGIGTQIIL